MTTTEFVYWLQGFMEIQNPKKLDKIQTQIIRDHLELVFDKKTPDRRVVEVQLTNESTHSDLMGKLEDLNNLDKIEPQPGSFIDIPGGHTAIC